jgi:hypothetical protein
MEAEQFFVHVTDCHGKVLEWCGKKFTFIPTKCGFAEIEVPPGCYSVFATHTPPGKVSRPPFGNRLTHVQVVRVNCGDHVCVTLFSPSMWHCGTWFGEAVKTQTAALEGANVDAKTTRALTTALDAFLKKLPPDEYAANTLEAVRAAPPQ